jgi:hypothetical protein
MTSPSKITLNSDRVLCHRPGNFEDNILTFIHKLLTCVFAATDLTHGDGQKSQKQGQFMVERNKPLPMVIYWHEKFFLKN